MWRTSWILAALLLSFEVSAREAKVRNSELTPHLQSRIVALKEGRGALIQSFQNKNQSYIYDQALAIIALSKEGKKSDAKKLLQGLSSLQLSDGSLYFSYYLDGISPYPAEGDRRIAGSIAWVALAATHYQSKFNDTGFVSFNRKVLNYLSAQMKNTIIQETTQRAIVFAPSDIESTAFDETDVLALEHNLDALSAFGNFAKLNGVSSWDAEIRDLKKFVMAMWDKDRHHFWSGASVAGGKINKSEFYLDNQTWSLLALDDQTIARIVPSSALQKACETLLTKKNGLIGFSDMKPTRSSKRFEFIWSEGTMGYALTMKKIHKGSKEKFLCKDQSTEDLISSVRRMKSGDGGIAYATETENPDFTTASSIAGTAWLLFAEKNINPFEVN